MVNGQSRNESCKVCNNKKTIVAARALSQAEVPCLWCDTEKYFRQVGDTNTEPHGEYRFSKNYADGWREKDLATLLSRGVITEDEAEVVRTMTSRLHY